MIKELRDSKKLSQAELGALVGTSQPQINRLEAGGRTLSKKWAERLAPHLGVTAAELMFSSSEERAVAATVSASSRGQGSMPQFPYRDSMEKDVPVLGTAAGSHIKGAFKLGSDVIDYVRRPAALKGAKDVYSLYVEGSSMEPQYFPGDLVFVNPNRPPRTGDIVIVQIKDSEDGVEGSIGILVKYSDTVVVLGKRNPPGEIQIKRSNGSTVHKVLSNNELFGV